MRTGPGLLEIPELACGAPTRSTGEIDIGREDRTRVARTANCAGLIHERLPHQEGEDMTAHLEDCLVLTEWLAALEEPDSGSDATYYLPNEEGNARAEYEAKVPSRLFDID